MFEICLVIPAENPEHKAALEYQAELFIEPNKLDNVRENGDQLAALCLNGSEELDDLEKALNTAN